MLGNEILKAKLSVLLNYTSTNILKDATMTLISRVIASNFIKAVSNFLTTTNMLKDTRTSSLSSYFAKVVTNTTSFTTADNDNKIADNNI